MTTRDRAEAKTVGSNVDDDGADRDQWVTPLKLARAVGHWDLDPCSNEFSHIEAETVFRLDRGQNGLLLARYVQKRKRVWINPPYSHGSVIQWVRAYRHTNFCFLVRFDVSTEWWAELWPHVAILATPMERVEFEPPPGVEDNPGSPFPHALLYRREADVSEEIRRKCYVLAKSEVDKVVDVRKGPRR